MEGGTEMGPQRCHHMPFLILRGLASVFGLQRLANDSYVFLNFFACMLYFIIF